MAEIKSKLRKIPDILNQLGVGSVLEVVVCLTTAPQCQQYTRLFFSSLNKAIYGHFWGEYLHRHMIREAHPLRAVSLKWKLLPVFLSWLSLCVMVVSILGGHWYIKHSTKTQNIQKCPLWQDQTKDIKNLSFPLHTSTTSLALQPWPSWARGVATTPWAPAHAKKKGCPPSEFGSCTAIP